MTPYRVFFKEHGLPLLVIALIILAGYFKIFTGASFLTTENNLATSNYTYGTTTNGWRPDKGMGLSFFFADVGMWHPWAPLAWWEKIMPSRTVAYNSSIVLLGILAAFTQYFFIRKVLPGASRWLAVCVAPLIVFCADQDGYHYLRVYISYLSGAPLTLMIVWDHFEKPRLVNIFKLALVFFFVAFFGTLWGMFQLFSLGFFFAVLYIIYFKRNAWDSFSKLVGLYVPAVLITVGLGFWEFYALFYEKSMVGYMREKMMTVLPSVSFGLDLKSTIEFLRGLFVMEWYPHNTRIVGIPTWPMVFQNYVNAVFPFVLLAYMFLKKKELSFWEFVLKWLVLLYFIHMALSRTNLVPGFGAFYSYINELSSKVVTMYGVIYPLQIPLIAFFLWRSRQHSPAIVNRWGNVLRKIFAVLIAVPFVLLAVFSSAILIAPDGLTALSTDLIHRFLPAVVKGIAREDLVSIAHYNLWCWQQITHWPAVIYYLSSACIAGVFVNDRWLNWASRLNTIFLAGFILGNGILLSWTIFPLENGERLWEQESIKQYHFEPTDRFYYVSGRADTLEGKVDLFKRQWSSDRSQLRATLPVGLLEPPGLNISGLKSFAPESEGQWVYQAFNSDGVKRLVHLRLYYGGLLYVSDLLDMSAVKYYYSDKPLEDLPDQLVEYFSARDLYVYKNTAAWDYFYLAQNLVVYETLEDIRGPLQGEVYVNAKDQFDMPESSGSGSVKLKIFEPGYMVFDFQSNSDELLVVADAWHPFWKASANGERVTVMKVNGIFKGVRLKPGHYDVTLVFDNSPYRLGIYVSIVAWIIFIGLFGWAFLKRKSIG